MKHLLVTILLLLFVVGGAGATEDFQRDINPITCQLDSTETDTLYQGIPQNRGKGFFCGYIWLDDLNATNGQATHDSVVVQYRPIFTGSDTLCSSAGGGITWTDIEIYNGPSGAAADFDNAITWVDSQYYMFTVDFDGIPWRGIQFLLTQTANDCTECDDSTSVKIYFDVD